MPLCTGADGEGDANLGVVSTLMLAPALLFAVAVELVDVPVPAVTVAVLPAVELPDDPQPARSASVQQASRAAMPGFICCVPC
jgi:hypothetical protein